jgi:F-type H+-transporting ATPase subunit delta
LTGSSRTAARRYAEALLDVATSTKASPEALRRELREAVALLRDHKELAVALSHPALGSEGRKKLVAGVWGKAKASPLFLRLLDLLASRNRLSLLPAIAEIFSARWNAGRGVASAEAVAAVELDAGRQKVLAEALKKATGNEVELETRVDPAVLGGLRVTVGGHTFDGTVRAQLQSLRRRLAGGP